MNKTIEKKKLIDWIKQLEDPTMLKNLKSLKESTEQDGNWWDEISDAAKESIKRGEEDIKADRVYSSEEFWEQLRERRKEKVNG